jgi:arsenite methyltransferase
MSDQARDERIKDAVREGYAARVKGGSCCGPTAVSAPGGCGCGDLASLGYSRAQIQGLPQGALANSFGCGNPAAFSEVGDGHVVLDVGSGAGIDCLIAGRAVGPKGRVIGLDMTQAMIERARENARQAELANVEFRLGDAEAMPVDDASVDWVISNCVINLAPDKRKVFREVARVLKPGGQVAISDIVFADDAPDLPGALANDPELYVACVAGAIRESRAGAGGGGGPPPPRLASFLADLQEAVVGKVWSARIVARKPGGPTFGVEPVGVEPARERDVATIEALLADSSLPPTGVAENLGNFLVARVGGRVVGCVGLELYGETALLRSLAVLPVWRGRGVGARLAREILERARRLGANEAVLLTTTVQAMAEGMGFHPIPGAEVPDTVRASWEFKADCCGAATVMRMTLAP